MSAVLVQELVANPTQTRPRWRHVPQTRGPVARPYHPLAPAGRPAMVLAPIVRSGPSVGVEIGQGLQLTRRGLSMAVTLFLAVVVAAVATVVTAFLSVSNDPMTPPAPALAGSLAP
jgi:hypothetical protein